MRRRGSAVLAALAIVLVGSAQTPSEARTTVGGAAFGVYALVPGIAQVVHQPVVVLPSAGGFRMDASTFDIPEVLEVVAARATIKGTPGDAPNHVLAQAEAEVGRVIVGPSAAPIVDIIGARSYCNWTNAASGAHSQIGEIRVNGRPLTNISQPAPNTVHQIGPVRLTLNAQRRATLPDGSKVITVDAVRIDIGTPVGPSEIIVAESACDPGNFPTGAEGVAFTLCKLLGTTNCIGAN